MRLPARINPAIAPTETKIVNFRDGPVLVPAHMAEYVTQREYPQWTFQEWVSKVANKGMENQVVVKAMGLMRLGHFGRAERR